MLLLSKCCPVHTVLETAGHKMDIWNSRKWPSMEMDTNKNYVLEHTCSMIIAVSLIGGKNQKITLLLFHRICGLMKAALSWNKQCVKNRLCNMRWRNISQLSARKATGNFGNHVRPGYFREVLCKITGFFRMLYKEDPFSEVKPQKAEASRSFLWVYKLWFNHSDYILPLFSP